MSKYKIKFFVAHGYVNGNIEETIDLVKDWNYTEQEAEDLLNSEEELERVFDEWLWENIDAGYRVFKEGE